MHSVETTSNPSDRWTVLENNILGSGSSITITDASHPNAAERFYRVGSTRLQDAQSSDTKDSTTQWSKEDILKRVSSNKALTTTERAGIFLAIAGSNINNFGFTQEEITKIINALNRP